MAFEIYEDRGSLALIVLHSGEKRGDCFEVIAAPEQAYSSGTEDNYISEVYFDCNRESFKAAYRVARRLSNARPGLVAMIPKEDVEACRHIVISPFHQRCVDFNRRAA